MQDKNDLRISGVHGSFALFGKKQLVSLLSVMLKKLQTQQQGRPCGEESRQGWLLAPGRRKPLANIFYLVLKKLLCLQAWIQPKAPLPGCAGLAGSPSPSWSQTAASSWGRRGQV